MDARIELSEEALNKALQVALLQQISEIGRENVIAKAIEFLTTPQENWGYSGKKVSPLMGAFYRAAESVVKELIEEDLKQNDSTFRLKIKETIAVGMEKWMNSPNWAGSEMSERIATAIGKALAPKDW